MSTATPLCVHYFIACMDKWKSWLSSNRTTGLSYKGLACAMRCCTYLTKWSSAVYSDGWTVH